MSATKWVRWDSTLSIVDSSLLLLQRELMLKNSLFNAFKAYGSKPKLRALSANDSEVDLSGAY